MPESIGCCTPFLTHVRSLSCIAMAFAEGSCFLLRVFCFASLFSAVAVRCCPTATTCAYASAFSSSVTHVQAHASLICSAHSLSYSPSLARPLALSVTPSPATPSYFLARPTSSTTIAPNQSYLCTTASTVSDRYHWQSANVGVFFLTIFTFIRSSMANASPRWVAFAILASLFVLSSGSMCERQRKFVPF